MFHRYESLTQTGCYDIAQASAMLARNLFHVNVSLQTPYDFQARTVMPSLLQMQNFRGIRVAEITCH